MKVPRSGKCGILPCVVVFEDFAGRAESIVMGTERRAELDKAYQQLIEALFKTVERAAIGHPKTPPDVIKFGMLYSIDSTDTHFTVILFFRKLQQNCR